MSLISATIHGINIDEYSKSKLTHDTDTKVRLHAELYYAIMYAVHLNLLSDFRPDHM